MRDRVVVAVTFLAMLELMKRREIVVEQAEPWGAIVARAAGCGRGRDEAPLDEAWSRSHDRRGSPAGMPANALAEPPRDAPEERPPLELTEAALEAPAVRRRAAAVAARDRGARRRRPDDRRRAARRPRGRAARSRDPARRRGRPGRARDGARGRRADRALRRRGRDPALAGGARDARDRRLPPARDEGGRRAHPRRRLRLHRPLAAASPAGRRAGPVGRARPAVPVRDRLRVPRALRADELDELPPLDVDVAARLAEEGGEPCHGAPVARRRTRRPTAA